MVATLKHFAVNDHETNRTTLDARIDEAAAQTAEPTDGQARSGNYAKGRATIGPKGAQIKVAVENKQGTTRSDKEHQPPQWTSEQKGGHSAAPPPQTKIFPQPASRTC